MKLITTIFVMAVLATLSFSAHAAAPQNQVPSCYAANPKVGQKAADSQRWLYLVIDQTVVLDENLKSSLADIIKHNVQPGMGFSVYGFSAFSQGHYMSHLATGVLEETITDKKIRDDVSVPALQKFDACIKGQYGYGLKLALEAVGKALQASSADLAKSDVIFSLTEVSHLVKENPVMNKQILLVSDMLENSTISSFYAKNVVRRIDAAKELKVVDSNNLFGDFAGAGVYVMGAGMMPEQKETQSKSSLYRDPKTLSALKNFWEGYFSRSNGNLKEFGSPELLSAIKW